MAFRFSSDDIALNNKKNQTLCVSSRQLLGVVGLWVIKGNGLRFTYINNLPPFTLNN